MSLNINTIRKDFPILSTMVHDKPLVYLDNAASTLKPKQVVDVISRHYELEASNIHRGVHFLSSQATEEYESVRKLISEFVNARSENEIIFTSGTTGSINLVAQSYGNAFLKKGDEILISHMEHHSNIVPWQMLCEKIGCVLKIAPINDEGEILMDEFEKLITKNTKIVSIVYISNSLGTINPVKQIIEMAHQAGAVVLLDAAQAAAHTIIDVQALNCDFLGFSGHKICGPTGVGVLFGKSEWLQKMPPVNGGGDMIHSVSFEKTTYADVPAKFEAGTPHIAGVIGMGEAIRYLQKIGLADIGIYENELLEYATKAVSDIPGIRLIGTAKKKSSIISFYFDEIHPHDLGTILDEEGVAIRAGHHCTQPVMDRFNVPATGRASFSFYNTKEEADLLKGALLKAKQIFA